MGLGRVEISRGGSVVVPSDFIGNHFETADPVLSQAKHIVSHDMRPCRWADIHTSSGVFNWTALDAKVAAAGSTPFTYTVWGTPTWLSARPAESHPYGNGRMAEPSNMAEMGNFVTALVNRYPTIAHIECWNEPDIAAPLNPPYWYSGTVATFVTMCQTIFNAAKAARPSITVIGPSSCNYLSSPNWLDAFFAAGGAAFLDEISMHAYQLQWATPLKAFLGLAHSAQYMRNAMSKAGISKPIHVTEFGQINPIANNVDDDTLVTGYKRAMVTAAALGYKRAAWYIYDGSTFGYSTRPAVVSDLAAFAKLLIGATLTNVYLNLPEQSVSATVNGINYVF